MAFVNLPFAVSIALRAFTVGLILALIAVSKSQISIEDAGREVAAMVNLQKTMQLRTPPP